MIDDIDIASLDKLFDSSSAEIDESLCQPSPKNNKNNLSNKQKKRPPKKPTNKPAQDKKTLDTLDLDKLLDGLEEGNDDIFLNDSTDVLTPKSKPAKNKKKPEPLSLDKLLGEIDDDNNYNFMNDSNDFKMPTSKSKKNKSTLDKIDLDKLLDGNEETKGKDMNENKKNDKRFNSIPIYSDLSGSYSPLQLFERNLMNYLNFTTNDLVSVFLSELKYNLDESFNYDHQIHDFLIHLRNDIEATINEQSSYINEINKRSHLNFGFYFDELTLPHCSSKANSSENAKLHSNNDIFNNDFISKLQTSKEKMLERSFSKLKEIKTESNQLKNNLLKLSNTSEVSKKLSNIRSIVEKEEMTIELYDKQINEISQRQLRLRNMFHEIYNYKNDSFHLLNDENDEEDDFDYLKNEILDIIKYFKVNKDPQKKFIRSEFYDKLNSHLLSIKNDMAELSEKLRNIDRYRTNSQPNSFYNSFQPSVIQNTSFQPDYYSNNQSFMNSPQVRTGTNNLIVTTARKRLENIQKMSRENNEILSNMY